MKIYRHIILLFVLTLGTAGAQDHALRVEGSNTFGEKLGPRLVAAFRKSNPGVDVILKRPGSGPGLTALIAGRTDIAPTSRPANAQELAAAKAAGYRLRSQSIGSYGVTIVVNKQNPLTNLKPEQVRGIFTGRITNWKQLGGPDRRIVLFVLDRTTGARAGFRELAMRADDYAASARALPDYEKILAAVASNQDAIGYGDMQPLPSGTRGLLINGQPANGAAIYEQVYPYASTLYFYTLAQRETKAARAFTRFVLSREGQRLIQSAGYVPRLPVPASVQRSIAP
jgi:phosphate transport system substrate-binding protein